MRTTVEITDAQRAELLRLAAERGEKGFSRLVQEAIDEYLKTRGTAAEKRSAAIASLGSLSNSAADRLEENVKQLRGKWR